MPRYFACVWKVSSAFAIGLAARGCAQGGPPLTAPVPIPDSRVGRVLKASSEAFNSGDSTARSDVRGQVHPQMNVAAQGRLRTANGGFDVVKILANQPTHIEVVPKDKNPGNYARARRARQWR